MTMWIAFVHGLNPNGHRLEKVPHWPRYDPDDPMNYVFGTSAVDGGLTTESDLWREEQLKWWNQHWSQLRC